MVLIIGGAYQGKTEYARSHYENCPVVEDFHLKLLQLSREGVDVEAAVGEMLPGLKDRVVIAEDIFCGVVPIDPVLRKGREDCGRGLALVAKNADEVVRVFCGLGTKIKSSSI